MCLCCFLCVCVKAAELEGLNLNRKQRKRRWHHQQKVLSSAYVLVLLCCFILLFYLGVLVWSVVFGCLLGAAF